jgi:hypothetical protein
MAVSCETHIRKRPYQPAITSYFHTYTHSASQAPRPTSPLSPPLPADTQASLLSVGMRVRKSVPEGYKTHKTIGKAGLPFASTAPASQPSLQARPSVASGGRELIPFCGLHKTGGWAAQEVPPSSAPAVMMRNESEMDVPGLSFSQSTFVSTQENFTSTGSGSRKRSYEEEAEEEMDAFFDEVEAEEGFEELTSRDERPIARMKGRSAKAKVEVGGPVRVFGENDFEEADFLAPMEVDGR